MEDYQQRVIYEKASLDEKIEALNRFVDSDKFDGLPNAERDRLERQFRVMTEYSKILGERIAAF